MAEETLGFLERELTEYDCYLKHNTIAAKRKLHEYKVPVFDPEQYVEGLCALKESHIVLSKLLSRIKEVKHEFQRLPEKLVGLAFACGAPLDSVVKTEIETEIVLAKLEMKILQFNELGKKANGGSLPSDGLPKIKLDDQLAENQKEEDAMNESLQSNENGKKSKRGLFG